MKLSVKALTYTSAILWGLCFVLRGGNSGLLAFLTNIHTSHINGNAGMKIRGYESVGEIK
jgi:hypothetical protein